MNQCQSPIEFPSILLRIEAESKEKAAALEKALRISREETEGMAMRIQSVIEIGEEKGKSK